MADQDQKKTVGESERLEQIETHMLAMAAKIADQEALIGELTAQQTPGEPPAEIDLLPQAPEGKTRFRSPSAEYKIVVEPRHPIEAGGRVIPANQRMIEFHGGIFDASDSEAEFLKAHAAYGEDYWEDPHATHRSVAVETGPRHAGRPSAPPRPEGRLVAKLS